MVELLDGRMPCVHISDRTKMSDGVADQDERCCIDQSIPRCNGVTVLRDATSGGDERAVMMCA